MKAKRAAKRVNFVSPNEKAKSAVVAQLVRIARKARLGYDDFLYISQQARKKLGLRRGRKERRLPQLLADADLKRFFRAIQDCGDVQHEILLKLLFYTAVRVSELVRSRRCRPRCLQDFYQSRQRCQGPLHPVSRELPPGAQKPPARRASQSISIRDSAVRAVHDTPNPANCARLSREGRHYAAATPPSVPPSDADLPDFQRPDRRTDSADIGPRKQKEP